MTITLEAKPFAAAMKDIAGIAERNSPVEHLKHVLIDAHDGMVSLTGANFEIWIERKVAADVSEPAKVCAEAQRLASVLSAFDPGSRVELEIADNVMTVKSGRARFRFPLLDAKGFPLPQAVEAEPITLGNDFLNAMRLVSHAIPAESVKSCLVAIAAQKRDDKLSVVAADGTRLAQCILPDPGKWNDLLIPRNLAVLMMGMEGDFLLAASERNFRVDQGDRVITAKALEDVYVQWWVLFEGDRPNELSATGDLFAAALNRMAIMSDSKYRTILFDLGEEPSMSSTDQGFDANEIVVGDYTGEPQRLKLSAAYLRDAVEALDADEVRIAFRGPRDPMLITGSNVPHFRAVLMPLLS